MTASELAGWVAILLRLDHSAQATGKVRKTNRGLLPAIKQQAPAQLRLFPLNPHSALAAMSTFSGSTQCLRSAL